MKHVFEDTDGDGVCIYCLQAEEHPDHMVPVSEREDTVVEDTEG